MHAENWQPAPSSGTVNYKGDPAFKGMFGVFQDYAASGWEGGDQCPQQPVTPVRGPAPAPTTGQVPSPPAAASAPAAAPASASAETAPSGDKANDSGGGNAEVKQFFNQVLSCVGVPSDRATATADAFAKAYGKGSETGGKGSGDKGGQSSGEKGGGSGEALKSELVHLTAQMLEETGNLKTLTEEADTDGKYGGFKGRGFIQLTHKENYQACVDYVKKNDPESSAKIEQIMQGGAAADKIIGQSAGSDLYLSAMCTRSWWEKAKAEKPAFDQACKEESSGACTVVSKGVNGGTNGLDVRLKKFSEVEKCAGSGGGKSGGAKDVPTS